MKEIEIGINEGRQRVDRFLKKYMPQASTGFIYKMLRKKRIKVNHAKTNPDYILHLGDKIQLYLSEATIQGFQKSQPIFLARKSIEVVYEDDNILLINKPKGVLVHGDSKEKEDTLINQVYYHLYQQGSFMPHRENTFSPAICNRLDRNTSGILIVAKNFPTLQAVNGMIRENKIEKKYLALVQGRVKGNRKRKGFLIKDRNTNRVKILPQEEKGAKFIHTEYSPIKYNDHYSLIEINLITGRSHQIRAHLASEGFPIIGDGKYGLRRLNREFYEKFGLDSQFLHAYSLKFEDCPESLNYLEDKTFAAELPETLRKILQQLFN